jgi:hypothetical protein
VDPSLYGAEGPTKALPGVFFLGARSAANGTIGPLVESLFPKDFREVIHMQTVTHTRPSRDRLDWGDVTIAIVVSRSCIVKDSERNNDRSIHLQLNYLVAVLGFSAVSVVHTFLGFGCKGETRCGSPSKNFTEK